MHLVYLDESGNTGMNLNDHEQPVFVLCALVVAEENWQSLERDLIATLNTHIPTRLEGFEMHAHHLRNGCGHFKGVSVAERLAIRNSWLELLGRHGCRVIYQAIEKKRFQRWLHHNFGTSGIVLNPHVAAFPLLAQVVNDYLRGLPGRPRGMFISDENKEIISDVEKNNNNIEGRRRGASAYADRRKRILHQLKIQPPSAALRPLRFVATQKRGGKPRQTAQVY